jgi:hypothetical protein
VLNPAFYEKSIKNRQKYTKQTKIGDTQVTWIFV